MVVCDVEVEVSVVEDVVVDSVVADVVVCSEERETHASYVYACYQHVRIPYTFENFSGQKYVQSD